MSNNRRVSKVEEARLQKALISKFFSFCHFFLSSNPRPYSRARSARSRIFYFDSVYICVKCFFSLLNLILWFADNGKQEKNAQRCIRVEPVCVCLFVSHGALRCVCVCRSLPVPAVKFFFSNFPWWRNKKTKGQS